MSPKTYVRCPECDTINLNSDYCKNCGALINTILKRKNTRLDRIAAQKEEQQQKPESNSKIKQLKSHRFWIVRAAANTVYWVGIAVMSIGAAIAYVAGIISA